MKISTKIQSILILIPIINLFSIFIWLYNYCFYENKNAKIWIKSLLNILVYILPAVIVTIVLANIWPNTTLIDILTKYIIPLLVGLSLVRFQNKLEKTQA